MVAPSLPPQQLSGYGNALTGAALGAFGAGTASSAGIGAMPNYDYLTDTTGWYVDNSTVTNTVHFSDVSDSWRYGYGSVEEKPKSYIKEHIIDVFGNLF